MIDPEFSVGLHRIEVHATAAMSEEPEMVWSITAVEAPNGSIYLLGYLRQSQDVGFGQAQVTAFTGKSDWASVSASAAKRRKFEEWVGKYAAEAMFDTARRALQAQAALMDFTFDMDPKAPEATVEYASADDAE